MTKTDLRAARLRIGIGQARIHVGVRCTGAPSQVLVHPTDHLTAHSDRRRQSCRQGLVKPDEGVLGSGVARVVLAVVDVAVLVVGRDHRGGRPLIANAQRGKILKTIEALEELGVIIEVGIAISQHRRPQGGQLGSEIHRGDVVDVVALGSEKLAPGSPRRSQRLGGLLGIRETVLDHDAVVVAEPVVGLDVREVKLIVASPGAVSEVAEAVGVPGRQRRLLPWHREPYARGDFKAEAIELATVQFAVAVQVHLIVAGEDVVVVEATKPGRQAVQLRTAFNGQHRDGR